MALTLNQIVSRIRTLALAHDQVNSFYFGDEPEFLANGEITYPAAFLVQLPGAINRADHLQTFNFRLFLLDRVGVSEDTEGNETDVLSDMHSVAADIIAMMMNSEYEADWMVVENSALTPVTEGTEDMVAGVIADIGVEVDFLADRCQVPADAVTIETDFDMARTKILSYTADGDEGDSFTVSGLAGKIVLAAYRAGAYKRVITTTPTSTETVKVAGTDLGDNKGVLASTGAVTLVSGDALDSGEIIDFLIYD